MKGLLVLVVVCGTALAPVQASEVDRVICSTCSCLGTTPYDVDCTTLALTEVPPMTHDNFSFPWHLDFANNRIDAVPQFPVLPNMLALSFQRNIISTIADEAFKNLPDLKKLSLQFNNLTEDSLGDHVFRGKVNESHREPLPLEELDLSYNHIRTLNNHAFQYLKSLKWLSLASNPVKDISWKMATAINELHSLEELDLSQTGLNRLPDHFLTDLTKLRVLLLADNQFTTVPSEVNYAHTLQHLNLNANPILSISVGDFDLSLATLRKLELSAMPRLRNIGKEAFSSLTRLEELHLSDNPSLSLIDPEAFFLLHVDELALRQLHLQGNNLMTLDEKLVPWLDLDYVNIQNNPWNCDCHFKWVAETLIPDLERKNPETTLSIMCAEPIADRGMKVANLISHPHTFECSAPHPFVQEGGRSGPLIVSTIVIGVILLLTGTLIFTYVLYRRSRDRQLFGERVKYRRAQNEDEEGITQTVHS